MYIVNGDDILELNDLYLDNWYKDIKKIRNVEIFCFWE